MYSEAKDRRTDELKSTSDTINKEYRKAAEDYHLEQVDNARISISLKNLKEKYKARMEYTKLINEKKPLTYGKLPISNLGVMNEVHKKLYRQSKNDINNIESDINSILEKLKEENVKFSNDKKIVEKEFDECVKNNKINMGGKNLVSNESKE